MLALPAPLVVTVTWHETGATAHWACEVSSEVTPVPETCVKVIVSEATWYPVTVPVQTVDDPTPTGLGAQLTPTLLWN